MSVKIETHISSERKDLPTSNTLSFGKYFADHMFVAKYRKGKGWFDAKIGPYEPIAMDPAASVLHYGQALFEGLKAFRQKDGSVSIFRPEFNWKRMQQGADRLCMEAPPRDLWMEAIVQLIQVCDRFVPKDRGTSLYIRPTLIGTEGFLGVRPSSEYLFYIILSPVASYYSEGSDPIKIWIERTYTRAAPGGLGFTKAAANYAGSLKAALAAKSKNYAQVLWLDVSKTSVEEVGTMNVFFVLGDEVITPKLDGTILEGGTREVVISILKQKGYKVSERKVMLDELRKGAEAGTLKEAFGTGTAAVISPIGELASDDFKISLKPGGEVAKFLFNEISAIHYGDQPDSFNWMYKVPKSST